MPDLIGHRVQKHSESARDTPEIKGTASTFPIKMRQVFNACQSANKYLILLDGSVVFEIFLTGDCIFSEGGILKAPIREK